MHESLHVPLHLIVFPNFPLFLPLSLGVRIWCTVTDSVRNGLRGTRIITVLETGIPTVFKYCANCLTLLANRTDANYET